MMNPAARDNLPGGYGELLLSSFLVVILVCILIWALGRFGAGRWRRLGRGRCHGPIQVIARAPLEVGQTLYVVEVSGRSLLLGSCEGQLSLLLALEPETGPRLPGSMSPGREPDRDRVPGHAVGEDGHVG